MCSVVIWMDTLTVYTGGKANSVTRNNPHSIKSNLWIRKECVCGSVERQ